MLASVRRGAMLLALALVVPNTASARALNDEPCADERYEACDTSRPAPSIGLTPDSPRAGGPATLMAYSPGRGISYAWDLDADGAFDDGIGASVASSFTAGNRRARVRATDEDGRIGDAEVAFRVHANNEPPTGELAYARSEPRVGQEIQVAGWGWDADGEVRRLELDADGDGDYELEAAADKISRRLAFATAGERTLRLRVTDDAGARTIATATVEVHAANLPPTVTVIAPENARVGRPVHLTGRASDRDGTIEATAFDLDGNGTYETPGGGEEEATVSFASAGSYVVGMRVTDDAGGTAVSRRAIDVKAGNDAPTVELYRNNVRDLIAIATDDGTVEHYAWDLDGDGAYDDDENAWGDATLPASATGDVEAGVRVTDDEGATAVARLLVRLPDDELTPPVVHSSPQQPRVGQPVWFDVGLAEDLESVEFDDGAGFKLAYYGSLEKTYAAAGTYSVRVRVRDSKGRSAIARHAVTVSPATGNLAPYAAIVGFSTVRTGAPVTLQANHYDADGSLVSYAWDTDEDGVFDDSTISEAAATFTTVGDHEVALRVTDEMGASSTQSKTLSVHTQNRAPRVRVIVPGPGDRTPIVRQGAALDLYPGAESSDDPLVAFAWDSDADGAFDDGAEVPKRVTFAEAGLRRVRVRGTDSGGLTGVGTLLVDVRSAASNHTPTVVLNVPVGARAGTPATLIASAKDADGDTLTYAWDADGDGAFDDGASASISFPYGQSGVYDVRVKVTDSLGAERVALRSLTVEAAGAGIAPVIENFALVSSPRVGRPTRLWISGHTGDETFAFDLDGDGAFDDVPAGMFEIRTWTFPTADPVTIAVRATDDAGRTALRTLEVTPGVENLPPTASIGAGPIIAGQPAELFANVFDPEAEDLWVTSWDLDGDGAYDDGDDFWATITVPAPGTYTVGLRVTDAGGATTTVSRTLVAGTQPPRPSFSASDIRPRPGQLVSFGSLATDPEGGPIVSTTWDLDDDGAFDDAAGEQVTVAAPAAGRWLVGLKVRDSGGDTAITYAPLIVAGEPVPTPVPTVSPTPTPPEFAPPPPPPSPFRSTPDTTPPALTVTSRAPRLRTLRRSGLPVTARCSEACAVLVVATVDKATAKALRLGGTLEVGRGSAKLTAAGTATVQVKLSARARKAVAARRTLRLKLAISAIDAAGNRRTVTRAVTVKR